jgi:hypothetical protein
MLSRRCSDCTHSDICKYKKDYDKVVEEITVKVPQPFTLMLNCRHYSSSNTYLTSSGNDYFNHHYDSTSDVAKPYLPGGPEIVY